MYNIYIYYWGLSQSMVRIPLYQQYFVGQCGFPNKIWLLIVRFYWPIKGKSYQSMIGIAFNKVGHQFATRAATASFTYSWGGTPGLVPLQEDGELLEKLKAAGALWVETMKVSRPPVLRQIWDGNLGMVLEFCLFCERRHGRMIKHDKSYFFSGVWGSLFLRLWSFGAVFGQSSDPSAVVHSIPAMIWLRFRKTIRWPLWQKQEQVFFAGQNGFYPWRISLVTKFGWLWNH